VSRQVYLCPRGAVSHGYFSRTKNGYPRYWFSSLSVSIEVKIGDQRVITNRATFANHVIAKEVAKSWAYRGAKPSLAEWRFKQFREAIIGKAS